MEDVVNINKTVNKVLTLLRGVDAIRRFAIGLIKKKPGCSVTQKMRRMNKNMRAVLDYLKMTRNICSACALDG